MTNMNTAPTVGIVVPAYNMEQHLAATLQSILNQTFSNWICCIVNDGSTDKSMDIACHFSDLDGRFYLLNEQNQGVCAARDNGMRTLPESVTYVAFLDGDDVWKPDALDVLYRSLHNLDYIGAHGLGETIDHTRPEIDKASFTEYGRARTGIENGRMVPWPPERATNFAAVVMHNCVFPPGLMLTRRDALERVGAWDPLFPILQDWDMVIRLTRQGDFRFVDQVVIEYVRTSTSASAWRKRNLIDARNIYYKTYHSPENSLEQKRVLHEGWRAWQRLKIEEKSKTLRIAIKRGDLKSALKVGASLTVHLIRSVRGYPTRKWL